MAQADYIISNQTFPNTRADINSHLQAIATNNSGTSAPTTQYAGQFWIDTTSSTWTMYIHDGSDDIAFATIDTSANTVNFTDSALDLVTDLSPQLGGNLDLNSNDITGTGNINITGTGTFSGDLTVDTNTLYVNSSTNKVGIGNSNPQNKLDITALTWDDGLTIKNTGNFNVGIIGDANRSSASGGILNLASKWNGTEVAGILFQAGSDTTNKDDGEIVFRTASAGTPTERMRINSSGQVGLGTSNPGYPLEIVTSGQTTVLHLNSTAGTDANITFANTGSNDSISVGANNDDLKLRTDDGNIIFAVSENTEKMRLSSNGVLGIGAVPPSGTSSSSYSQLQVGNSFVSDSEGTNSSFQLLQNAYVGSGNNNYATVGSGASHANRLMMTSGVMSFSRAYPVTADSQITFSESMRIDSSGRVGIGESSPDNTLHVNSTSSTVTKFERDSGTNGTFTIGFPSTRTNLEASGDMRLTATRVLVNKTAPGSLTNGEIVVAHDGGSTYGIRIDSTGTSGTQYHMSFDRGETQAGYITSNSATTIAFNNASDERLKENIQNSGSAIQDIKNMQVRQFDWVDGIDTHRDFGFVAQELVNVVPEAVTRGTDELDENGKPVRSWGVDYSHIVPRLVKVCQEQQTKIEELEARITALETNQP